jgi:photosystem II stability/assembly factor-like uncharacterized protein
MKPNSALAALLALLASTATAQVDPALYGQLHWRLVGPFRGGRVLTVSGIAGEPDHFFFGAVNGGVWESRNAGRTWAPIFDGQPIGSIGALAVAPSDPKVLWVGTGEADMRSDIAQGAGVFRSTDGGATWAGAGLADSQQIGRIRVDPRDAAVAWVAALGHPYGPNAERGLYRTRDGGATWQKVLGSDENTGAIDVALEPGHPDVVYAALWRTRRTPWNIYAPAGGPGSGLYKSSDGGATWTALGGGLPREPGRIGIAIAPSRPQRVYALVDAEAGGLYRSDDAGATWTRVSDDARIWQRGWYFGGVAVDPRDPDVVYALNVTVFRSSDGGRTFVPFKGAPGGDDYHEVWIDPADPRRMILGADQGAVVTADGGATWSSWYNQPTAQLYHVSTDSRFPYWIYGAQQDSGAVALPSRTASRDGINLRHFREVTAGGEADIVIADPRDPDVVWGGTVERLDLRTEQTRVLDPTTARPDLWRRTWTLPLAFSPRDPRVLYFAHQRIFRTEDEGEHWSVISPDLTREDPGVPPNLDPVTAAHDLGLGPRRGVVYALAPSRVADGDLWAGTDDGKVWRTRDGGKSWQDVTPPALTAWSKVGVIEASPFDAGTAYLAVDRHRLDDRAPYVYRTHDGGATWRLVVAGIPPGHFVNAVREDPVRRGLLYAATEEGVEVSFDDGEHWQSLRLGLPVTSVRDLEVHGDDLVIATHGRGFWVLDGIGALRQADAAAGAAPVTLFAPAPAVRVRPEGFAGTPFPKDEPMAVNPPFGAWIDYFLRADASAPVTLEILDHEGTLVRRYSSAVAPRAGDPARLRVTPDWVHVPSMLSAAAGAHRFVWPLRYPAPAELAEGDPYADGVWAPPGSYQVVLTVDGHRLTQPLELRPDPRLTLPPAAYAREFGLARAVERERVRVAAAVDQADGVRKRLTARRAGPASSARFARELAAAERRLADLSGVEPMSNALNVWGLPPRSVTALRWLESSLGTLAQAVDGADAEPSAEASEALTRLTPLVERALADWQGFRDGDLARLDRLLARAGREPVSPPR